jgi:hypothetical protein
MELTSGKSTLGDGKGSVTAKVKITSTREDGTLDSIEKVHLVTKVTGGKAGDSVDTASSSEAHVTANFATKNGKMTIEGEVQVTLKARKGGNPIVLTERLNPIEVAVVGASPTVTLQASPSPADADGISIVTIKATITLFGEPYTDDVFIKNPEFDPVFFELIGTDMDRYHSQSLQLSCKFHSKDAAIRRLGAQGTRVSANVFFRDPDLASCFPDGIPEGSADVDISLNPSKSVIAAEPDHLPRAIEDESMGLFQAKMKASVVSASGGPVDLKDVGDVGDFARNSVLRFIYASPECQGFDIPAAALNDKGQFLFNNGASQDPYYIYDHEEKCWDNQNYRFKVPTCELGVSLEMWGEVQDSIKYKINDQIKSVHISWDYSPFFLSFGRLTHPLPGIPDVYAGFDRSTFLKYLESIGYIVKHDLYMGHDVIYELYRRNPQGAYIKIEKNRKGEWKETPEQLLPLLPANTILIGDGGHHCIVVRDAAGNQTIQHFMMALTQVAGKPQPVNPGRPQDRAWFNRDQIWKMRDHQRNRPAMRFADAYVYVDSFDDWTTRTTSGLPYNHIEVLYPTRADVLGPSPIG